MAKPIYIWRIAPNYVGCKVWHGTQKFHDLVGTSTLTLDKELTRRERYDVVVNWLSEGFSIAGPPYQPTKREAAVSGD